MLERAKGLLAYLRYFEPARLRAIYSALVVLLGTLGVALPAGLDARVAGVIAAIGTVWALVQGEVTRAAVYSPATADAIKAEGVAAYQAALAQSDAAAPSVPTDSALAEPDAGVPPSA